MIVERLERSGQGETAADTLFLDTAAISMTQLNLAERQIVPGLTVKNISKNQKITSGLWESGSRDP